MSWWKKFKKEAKVLAKDIWDDTQRLRWRFGRKFIKLRQLNLTFHDGEYALLRPNIRMVSIQSVKGGTIVRINYYNKTQKCYNVTVIHPVYSSDYAHYYRRRRRQPLLEYEVEKWNMKKIKKLWEI